MHVSPRRRRAAIQQERERRIAEVESATEKATENARTKWFAENPLRSTESRQSTTRDRPPPAKPFKLDLPRAPHPEEQHHNDSIKRGVSTGKDALERNKEETSVLSTNALQYIRTHGPARRRMLANRSVNWREELGIGSRSRSVTSPTGSHRSSPQRAAVEVVLRSGSPGASRSPGVTGSSLPRSPIASQGARSPMGFSRSGGDTFRTSARRTLSDSMPSVTEREAGTIVVVSSPDDLQVLPSRVVYLHACRRTEGAVRAMPTIVYGLDQRVLSLRHRPMGDKDVLPLAVALRDGAGPTRGLDLGSSGLSDWAVAAVCDGLLTNRHIRIVDLSHLHLGKGFRGQHGILRLLATNTRIRRLNLASNSLGDGFVAALHRVLCKPANAQPIVPDLQWENSYYPGNHEATFSSSPQQLRRLRPLRVAGRLNRHFRSQAAYTAEHQRKVAVTERASPIRRRHHHQGLDSPMNATGRLQSPTARLGSMSLQSLPSLPSYAPDFGGGSYWQEGDYPSLAEDDQSLQLLEGLHSRHRHALSATSLPLQSLASQPLPAGVGGDDDPWETNWTHWSAPIYGDPEGRIASVRVESEEGSLLSDSEPRRKGLLSHVPTDSALVRPPPTCVAQCGIQGPYPPLAPSGNTSLTHLILSGNEGITAASAGILASLVGVPENERANVRASNLRSLAVAWCDLGSTGAIALMEAASHPPQSLTSLDLSFVGMDDTAAEALGALLEENGGLTSLDVSHNRLGPRAGMAVAKALPNNPVLSELHIGFNPLGLESSMAIALALKTNVDLEVLGMENTVCDARDGDAAGQALWNRVRRVNLDRVQPVQVALEWPPVVREWDHKLDPVLDTADALEADREDSLVWSVRKSIFAFRMLENDSGSFIDEPILLRKAFDADWEQTKADRIVPSPQARAAVSKLFRDAYPLLREVFRGYSLSKTTGEPFDMSYQEMVALWRECWLPDLLPPERRRDQQSLLDLCWVATNYEVENSEINPADALLRYEFVEALLRLAIGLFPPKRRRDDEAKVESVRMFLADHILPIFRDRMGVLACSRAMYAARHDLVVAIGLPGGQHERMQDEEDREEGEEGDSERTPGTADIASRSFVGFVIQPSEVAAPGFGRLGFRAQRGVSSAGGQGDSNTPKSPLPRRGSLPDTMTPTATASSTRETVRRVAAEDGYEHLAGLSFGDADIVSNAFRHMWVYREDVDKILSLNEESLQLAYDHFTGRAQFGDSSLFLSVHQYLDMMRAGGLCPDIVPEAVVKASFVWSAMSVVDEHRRSKKEMLIDAHDLHTWTEYLESVCRLAGLMEGDSVDQQAQRNVRKIRKEMRKNASKRMHRTRAVSLTQMQQRGKQMSRKHGHHNDPEKAEAQIAWSRPDGNPAGLWESDDDSDSEGRDKALDDNAKTLYGEDQDADTLDAMEDSPQRRVLLDYLHNLDFVCRRIGRAASSATAAE